MATRKKRPRSESEFKSIIDEARVRGAKYAVTLLDRSLSSYCLDSKEHLKIIEDATASISNSEPCIGPEMLQLRNLPIVPKKSRVLRHSYRVNSGNLKVPIEEENNEFCEICECDGNLLCCDTCKLVFHLTCLRPKLDSIPKGSWSCPFCVADHLAPGDVLTALDSIEKMWKLCQKYTGDVEIDESKTDTFIKRLGYDRDSISILKSAGRFLTKRRVKNSFIETGRYWTLEEALNVVVAGKSETNNKKLDCSYCLDDENISICAFCGCQKCFGKLNLSQSLNCSTCNGAYHLCCSSMAPPSAKPSSAWHCSSCQPTSDSNSNNVLAVVTTEAAVLSPGIQSVAVSHGGDVVEAEETGISITEKKAHITIVDEPVIKSADGQEHPVVSQIEKALLRGQYSNIATNSPSFFKKDPSPSPAFSASQPSTTPKRSYTKRLRTQSESNSSLRLSQSPSVADHTPVCSLETCLALADISCSRKLTELEKSLLAQFRKWASKSDLKKITAALTDSRNTVVSKLSKLPQASMQPVPTEAASKLAMNVL